MEFKFTAELEKWAGDGGWHLVYLPKKYYADLKEISSSHKRGFGAIKVEATAGKTTWQTSIFPDNESKAYLLFIKKQIRDAEKMAIGDSAKYTVKTIELG